ncbi:MAG: oxidoreductase [Gammaproteobacteria bacterium]|nr:MAG: oxidoreductase [Gammaproteobacteria bacterium]
MRYESPQTVDQAISLLAGAGGDPRVLAGGTDLLVQLRAGVIDPELIVDIKQIDEAMAISTEAGGFRVGAAVSGARLKEHDTLSASWPGVVEAADLIGSTQIQGRASMGGNLCNASPAADTVPALIAAGATCALAGPGGRREVPVEEICTGPGQTILTDGEFVVSILLPARGSRSGDAYLLFIPRTEMDIAVVGVGVSLSLDREGQCSAARVAVGAVAPTALLVPAAAEALVGGTIDDAAIDAMAAAVRAVCRPIDDKRGTVAYRIEVAGVLAERACRIALDRAGSA